MDNTKDVINKVSPYLSMAKIAERFFGKGRNWLSQKINRSIVNGVEYRLTDDEILTMCNAFQSLAEELSEASDALMETLQKHQRNTGRYYTTENPFEHSLFHEWLSMLPSDMVITEPFAGSCNIPMLIKDMGYDFTWKCFDISPSKGCGYKVVKRDTIANFPKSKVVITNPPYLAKNSATRRNLSFPDTMHDDLYKHCLDLILSHCDYAAVLIPDSFIAWGQMTDRLYGVVSLNRKMFSDTDCPVCLALFVPYQTHEFQIYISDRYIGTNLALQYDISSACHHDWVFNAPNGSIGIKCTDSSNPDIAFYHGAEISTAIKSSSRTYTRIGGLPDDVPIDDFLQKCNEVLMGYRAHTRDVWLTAYKGIRKDGCNRRRISFTLIREILDVVAERYYNSFK